MEYQLCRQFSLFLIFLFVMTACQQNLSASLIDDPNCQPPCWINIQPGQTTAQEVVAILVSTTTINPDSIERAKTGQFRYTDNIFWEFTKGEHGVITLDNERVADISFNNMSVSLSYALKKYGEPEKVIIYPMRYPVWDIYLLYPSKGVVLGCTKRQVSKNEVRLRENDRIERIIYTAPSSFQSLLETMVGQTYRTAEGEEIVLSVEKMYQEWAGFARYKFIIPIP